MLERVAAGRRLKVQLRAEPKPFGIFGKLDDLPTTFGDRGPSAAPASGRAPLARKPAREGTRRERDALIDGPFAEDRGIARDLAIGRVRRGEADIDRRTALDRGPSSMNACSCARPRW